MRRRRKGSHLVDARGTLRVMAWRILRLLTACSVLVAVGAPACGGSSSETRASAGNVGVGGNGARAGAANGGSGPIGRAGAASTAGTAGTAPAPTPVACGNTLCDGVVLPFVNVPIPGCCADAKTSRCGLDSSALDMSGMMTFAEACQPLDQPGTTDESCPQSPKVPVPNTGLTVELPGCCRPDHTCGYELDTIGGVVKLGLGCVDANQFGDGGTAQSCGAGAAGAGGDNGGAGAGGDTSGVAGATGDSGAGGTSG